MTIDRSELGSQEMFLSWIGIWRLFWLLNFLLIGALFFENTTIEIILWIITAILYWSSVGAWGYSVFAIMQFSIPLYVFLEWNESPKWLAYVCGVLFVIAYSFIKKRIGEVNELYESEVSGNDPFEENEQAHLVLNSSGEVAGGVVKDESGLNTLVTDENSDMNSLMYSLAIVFAQDLSTDERIKFSMWAGLTVNDWTTSHQDLCALALMHYFCEANESGTAVPEAVAGISKHLIKDKLPPLERPLNEQMKNVFDGLFGT